MWLFTPVGFMSVVSHDKKTLVVRSRDAGDLKKVVRGLRAVDSKTRIKIHATPGRDYGYRIFVPRRLFARWFASTVAAIEYTNFKSEIGRTDPAREIGRAHV